MVSYCCRDCVKAGRTSPGERATHHADEAARLAREARVWAVVSLLLAGISLTLLAALVFVPWSGQ